MWKKIKKPLLPVFAMIGAIWFIVNQFFTAQQIVLLGWPVWIWQIIGASIFFSSVLLMVIPSYLKSDKEMEIMSLKRELATTKAEHDAVINKKKLLQELKTLYEMKEVKEGFPSRESCLDWANKVAPLLKFNQQYYDNFWIYAHRLNLDLSSYTLKPVFRIMISQLQMAINELKNELENVE